MTVNELATINGISPSQYSSSWATSLHSPKPKKTAEALLYVEPRTPVAHDND